MANLKKLAEIVGGRLQGDAAREIKGVQALQKAGRDKIAFVAKGKEDLDLTAIQAGALVVAAERLPSPQMTYGIHTPRHMVH